MNARSVVLQVVIVFCLERSTSPAVGQPLPPQAANAMSVTLPRLADCNTNGLPDECDLECGTSGGACDLVGCGQAQDCNTNGLPDECDVNHDCCDTGHGPGCRHEHIEACVCDIDRYCCSVDWDEVCVGLVIGEACGPCDPDCNDNAIPDECDLGVGQHDCCDVGHGAGCSDAGIEACVCAEDRYCCLTEWDAVCVAEVIDLQCGTCPGRDCNANTVLDECELSHDCCDTGHGPGCSHPAIEACVCDIDRFCCAVTWDGQCVGLVAAESCGSCDPDCNANLIPDDCDFASGESVDCNSNGLPDECDPRADFDADGDIDLYDHASFVECLTGPAPSAPLDPASCCALADLDDFAGLQRIFSPPCGDDADCDDALFCTGAESCVAGACVPGTDPCPGQFCDEANDACAPYCVEDVDCADGLFCTGEETCNTDGVCEPGLAPCDPVSEQCDEATDTCSPLPGGTYYLTLAQDVLTGTVGADTFIAPLAFNPPTGTNIPTLQTGDMVNGGLGPDTLTATFNFGPATTVSPSLAGIEVFNVTDFGGPAGGTIIAGGAITGLETINISNSTNVNVLTFTNLPALADVSLANQTRGATFTFAAAASSGTGDTVNMSFSNFTATPGPTVTYTTGTTNGAETLNLESTGAANTVDDIVMNGTTLTRINITGDQQFTLTQSIDANVTTVDASGSTGGVTVFQNNASVFTFTGGSGNDTILLGGTYTTTDTLSGGSAGTDTIGGSTATLGGTTANQTNVSNFEAMRITDQHTTALNMSHWGTIGTVTLDAGANSGTITNASTGIALNLGARATDPAGGGALGLTVAGVAVTDTATFTLNDCDQTGNVTFTGVETLSLVSNLDLDGSAAAGGTHGVNTLAAALILTDTAAQEVLNITGTESLTIVGAITANQINATNFTQPFIMGAATTVNGVTVNGGSGADTLFASAGADILNGNAGNDILNSLAGADIVTGGSGADIFRQSAGAADGADRQSITDFDDTVGFGDVFNLNNGLGVLTGTNNFADSSSMQTHSAAGNLNVTAAAEVVRVTSGTVADFTSANSLNGTNLLTAIGGTITAPIVFGNRILICVADTSGNVGVYYASSGDNAIIAGEITLVGVLQGANVAIANVVFNNFANGA